MKYKVYKDGELVTIRDMPFDERMVIFGHSLPTRLERLEKINLWNMNSHGWKYVLVKD